MSPRTHWPGSSAAAAATMMTMSRRGDLDLNHAPSPAAPALWDSMKDGLRRAMLEHEIIFKSQVRELHRLYWTQKSLMRDVCWKRSASVSGAKSRCGSAEVNKVGGVLTLQGMPSEFRVSRHRDFDLEVPAIGFDPELAQDVTDELLLVKGPDSVQSDAAGVGREEGNCDDGGTVRGVSRGNGCFMIDLEAPVEMELDEEASGICSSGLKILQNSGVNVNGLPVEASGLRNDSAHLLSEEQYHADNQRENRFKSLSVHPNFGPSGASVSGCIQSVNSPTQKCQPTPKYLHIDLNIAQDGITADVCPEPMQKFPSLSASSSRVISGDQYKKSNAQCLNHHPPSSENQTQTNSVLPDLVSHGSEKSIYSGLKYDHNFIRLSSDPSSTVIETACSHEKSALDMDVQRCGTESPVEFCRNSIERISSTSNGGTQDSTNGTTISLIGLSKQHRDEKVVSSLARQQVGMHVISRSGISNVTCSNEIEYLHPSTESTNLIRSTDVQSGGKPTPDERNEEDTVSSRATSSCGHQGDQNKKSPDCNKLDLLSGSTEFTSSNNNSVPENARVEAEALKPEGISSNDQSFDVCASNPEESEQLQALVPDADLMIAKAAEILLYMSLENSASPYAFNCDGQEESETDEAKSQPQFLSDSFEEMTLKLEEIKDDGSSATFKQLEKESAKESCGIKLRRGRGLRDFQKDILPGLVSLSRHEICEDIHAIKHELRKNKSHATCDESFLTPVRRRRSLICNASRRS